MRGVIPVRICPRTPRRRPRRSCRSAPASPRPSRWRGGTRPPSDKVQYKLMLLRI